MVARLLRFLALGAATLPLGATLAFADDGPPRFLSAAGRLRPPETIERVVSVAPRSALVTVRGYGATPEERAYWDPLWAAMPDLDHRDFGTDFGRYDTRGSVAANGDALRREIQRFVREDDVASVSIVSVSMGGVVTDAAFGSGLSARDNVTAWTTLASPLNGSTTARVVRGADRVAAVLGVRKELAGLLAPLGADAADTAMQDLAEHRAFSPPRGVPLSQFWALTDELVLDADAHVGGARYVRTLTPTLLTNFVPAHGGQLNDPRVREMVVAAARGERPRELLVERVVAAVLAPVADAYHLVALLGLAAIFLSAAVLVARLRAPCERLARWRG